MIPRQVGHCTTLPGQLPRQIGPRMDWGARPKPIVPPAQKWDRPGGSAHASSHRRTERGGIHQLKGTRRWYGVDPERRAGPLPPEWSPCWRGPTGQAPISVPGVLVGGASGTCMAGPLCPRQGRPATPGVPAPLGSSGRVRPRTLSHSASRRFTELRKKRRRPPRRSSGTKRQKSCGGASNRMKLNAPGALACATSTTDLRRTMLSLVLFSKRQAARLIPLRRPAAPATMAVMPG
jgi:hypothetical protein